MQRRSSVPTKWSLQDCTKRSLQFGRKSRPNRARVQTKEGSTAYLAGDYLVFNAPDRKDGYAMKAETFRQLYESSG